MIACSALDRTQTITTNQIVKKGGDRPWQYRFMIFGEF